jgi:hypothetical protein
MDELMKGGWCELTKKRPCKICRKWFNPNPCLRNRQKTCGDPQCQKEWHKRSCDKWNRNNREYFRGIYLKKKILAEGGEDEQDQNSGTRSEGGSRYSFFGLLGLPLQEIKEVMGAKMLIVIEYIFKVLMRAFQEMLRIKPIVNTG